MTEKTFWSRVNKNGPIIYPKLGKCWEWDKPAANGYGPHRYSWSMKNGPIPKGKYICHKCDNRRCIRLSHLFLGTPLANVLDMINKGRNRPSDGGWSNPNAEIRRKELKERFKGNKHALGHKLSIEHKAAIGQASKGNKRALGHKHSPEIIEIIRTTHLGQKRSKETCQKMKNAWKSRKLKYGPTRRP